jgi:hypothetical protein
MSLNASNVVDILSFDLKEFGENIYFDNGDYDYEKICEVLKKYKLVKKEEIKKGWSLEFFSLVSKLQGFDWYYEMSDDHRYWVAGERARAEVQKLIDKLILEDKELVKAILKEFAKVQYWKVI